LRQFHRLLNPTSFAENPIEQVRFREIFERVAATIEDGFGEKQTEPECLRLGDRGRQGKLLPVHENIDECRPVMRKGRLQRGPQFFGFLYARSKKTARFGHFAEVRIREVRTERHDAGRHHLDFNERKRVVIIKDDFNRHLVLDRGQKLAHEHREAAVSRQRDDLTIRKGRLRADRLGQRARHRTVRPRADQTSLPIETEIACHPNRGRTDVRGEDRILRCQLALIWELRELRRKLHEAGRAHIDEAAIFEAYRRLREREARAVSETKRTRRARARRPQSVTREGAAPAAVTTDSIAPAISIENITPFEIEEL
jgi:hypothetical protein